MGNLFAWLFVGLIVFGIIVYANPQILEYVTEITEKNQLIQQKTSTTSDYNSIKDIAQNPDDYIGQTIIVKGKLIQRVGGPSISAEEDYWIWLDEWTCQERQRDYDYGKTYSAEGTFIIINRYPEQKGISCSKPIQ